MLLKCNNQTFGSPLVLRLARDVTGKITFKLQTILFLIRLRFHVAFKFTWTNNVGNRTFTRPPQDEDRPRMTSTIRWNPNIEFSSWTKSRNLEQDERKTEIIKYFFNIASFSTPSGSSRWKNRKNWSKSRFTTSKSGFYEFNEKLSDRIPNSCQTHCRNRHRWVLFPRIIRTGIHVVGKGNWKTPKVGKFEMKLERMKL